MRNAAASISLSPVDLERRYGARNYDPLAVTLERGDGVWCSTPKDVAIST